jgi:ubiquinone biosynthesis protein
MSAIGTLLRLPQYARNVRRLQEILGVVARHGFGHVVERGELGRLVGARRTEEADEALARLRWEERFRLALEALGPTFVKLGQMMATRPDLFPMSLIFELRKLQDDVPPIDVGDLKAFVEAELEQPLTEAYAWFSDEPLAAASIAQVHRARLHTGEEVVVKVQRPGLDTRIRDDLELLRLLAANLEERMPELRRFRPAAALEEFARSLQKETDFRNEVANIERFGRNFEANPRVTVPETYPALCTRRVITMAFIDGAKVTDAAQLEAWGIDGADIAALGTELVIDSIFVHGFFHADPHPGNYFVLRDGRAALIDFGMMGTIDRDRIDDLLRFLIAILLADPEMLVSQLIDLGLVDDRVDVRALRGEVHELLARHDGKSLEQLDIGSFIAEIFDTVVRYNVQMPADLLLVGKAISTMEGIAQDLHPQFEPIAAIRPQLTRLYVQRAMDPKVYSRRIFRTLNDYYGLVRALPQDVRGLVRRAKAGELQLQTRDMDAERRDVWLERHVNRALLTCSSLVSLAGFTWLLPQAIADGAPTALSVWAVMLAIFGSLTGAAAALSLLRGR